MTKATESIPEDVFRETAERLYEDPLYGDVALNVLEFTGARFARGAVIQRANGRFLSMYENPREYAFHARLAPGQVREKLLKASPHSPYKFKIVKNQWPDKYSSGARIAYVRHGDVSADGLPRFLSHFRYGAHQLHGTLGRAVNVLLAVGTGEDQAPETLPDTAFDGDFISHTDLKDHLLGSPLSVSQQWSVTQKIRQSGRTQVLGMRPRPMSQGEVIFDGAVDMGSHEPGFLFDRVALHSLGQVIPSMYRPTTAPGQWLRTEFGAH